MENNIINGKGVEREVRKWKYMINMAVKNEGLSKWTKKRREKALDWYREKEAPKCEVLYEGSLGSGLFRARAQCLDVKAKNHSRCSIKIC